MTELLYYKNSANLFMKCSFTEVHQFYLCSKKFLKYLNTVVFKYYCYCITEFVYVHQASTSLARTRIIFKKNFISQILFFWGGGGGGMLQPPFLKVSFPPHQITILI